MLYIFVKQKPTLMQTSSPPDTTNYYCTTVKVGRNVQRRLQAEQAKRVLKGEKKISINDLASELLTRAAEKLPE